MDEHKTPQNNFIAFFLLYSSVDFSVNTHLSLPWTYCSVFLGLTFLKNWRYGEKKGNDHAERASPP